MGKKYSFPNCVFASHPIEQNGRYRMWFLTDVQQSTNKMVLKRNCAALGILSVLLEQNYWNTFYFNQKVNSKQLLWLSLSDTLYSFWWPSVWQATGPFQELFSINNNKKRIIAEHCSKCQNDDAMRFSLIICLSRVTKEGRKRESSTVLFILICFNYYLCLIIPRKWPPGC